MSFLASPSDIIFNMKDLLAEIEKLRKRISELERLEEESALAKTELLKSEAKYRSLVESTDDSIYLIDRDYRYLFINKRHLQRLGVREEEIIGKTYGEFHSPEETRVFIEKVDSVFETGESIQHEHRSERDGKYFLRTLSPVKDQEGNVIAVSVISKNVTDIKRMEDEFRKLSLSDELTGLYNRRGFLTLAVQQLKMASRFKGEVCLLYIDLDNLKSINDRFGHKEGDTALIETANILRKTYRESDIIARIGGDEFAVLAVGTTDTCEELAKRLQENLRDFNRIANREYTLSLSIGIAHCDSENPSSIEELLIQADRAMYEEKRLKHGVASSL